MGIKIIITGATGFVGEGVLLSCLNNAAVAEVLMVNRRHYELQHPKLKELIVPDFMKLEDHRLQLSGYDACLYCAGISSVGMNEAQYTHITYDTTMHFARELATLNPGMVFDFVSGSHTDGSGKGKVMWARVKGKTENALATLAFKKTYNFRPGGMKAVPGQRNAKTFYKVMINILSFIIPGQLVTLQQVGDAMINAVLKGYPKQTLEIKDIQALAKG